MEQFTILRETKTNSGVFESTNETLETIEAALERCGDLTAEHNARFAVYPYSKLKRLPKTPEPAPAEAEAETKAKPAG